MKYNEFVKWFILKYDALLEMWIAHSLAASTCYATDVVFAKKGLDEIPVYVFVALIAFVYNIVLIGILFFRGKELKSIIMNKSNGTAITWSLFAIIIGTVMADTFLWLALRSSGKGKAHIVSAIVHTAPVISLFLLYFMSNYKYNRVSFFAFICAIISTITLILNDGSI